MAGLTENRDSAGNGGVGEKHIPATNGRRRITMPIRNIPNTQQPYYLINFDSDGKERAADGGAVLSQVVLDELKKQPVTAVFVMSHGWVGDLDDAKAQYDKWMANLWNCAEDRDAVMKKRPDFTPLLIGIHWPSKPFGNENSGGAFDFNAAGGTDDP